MFLHADAHIVHHVLVVVFFLHEVVFNLLLLLCSLLQVSEREADVEHDGLYRDAHALVVLEVASLTVAVESQVAAISQSGDTSDADSEFVFEERLVECGVHHVESAAPSLQSLASKDLEIPHCAAAS